MLTGQEIPPGAADVQLPSRARIVYGTLRYLLGKALLIGLTIFLGVFATVLIVNQTPRGGLGPARSPFEIALEQQITSYLRSSTDITDEATSNAMQKKLRSEAGLDLPFWSRHLLWTYKALTFDWGRLTLANPGQLDIFGRSRASARDIILQYFPNTILLMGTAYLLVFLIGIPLALYLARHYGGKLDRVLALLSPMSSVPSWVIAILLIALFAVELRWFPISGMFDLHKPEDPVKYVSVLLRHMVLPVSAIVISLLFQLVYAWRTFFVIYAEEDFVELGRAKGLAPALLERQYVLRPALPYVITSFALSLIGFWQTTMALEVVFQWRGLGWLYITKALPNFWGESVYPGELIIAVGIVVIFAYLLGILVFVLDIVYVLVDPRIRLHAADSTLSAVSPGRIGGRLLSPLRSLKSWLAELPTHTSWDPALWLESFRSWLADSFYALRDGTRFLSRQLWKDPVAMFGVTIIALLFAGSAYAVVALPYEKIGRLWDSERLTGRAVVPRLAAPAWTNLFARSPRLSTLIIDEQSQQTSTSVSALEGSWVEKTATFSFDYSYADFPSEAFLYLDPTYTSKRPFVSLVWVYPDGRRLDLRGTSAEADKSFDFEAAVNVNRLLAQYPEWRNWYVPGPANRTPAFDFLFAAPGSIVPRPMPGSYRLEVKSLLFETGSDVRSQLVLLGQVYGAAGTDYWRRDLLVPLLWGMPFTLVFGLLGATVTTVLAMLLSATGVWLGGWVDALIQRFTEVNMVLPALAIGVLASALLGISLWVILGIIILLNVFGAPTRTFRSAFLQEKQAPYIEAARAYGAGSFRIISGYLVPRILPMLIPQLVILVPSFVFLEATLGIFNIRSIYPTWGRIIYEGLSKGALYSSRFWVLEPIALLLLTGLAFALFGSALERALNPRTVSDVDITPVARIPAPAAIDKREPRHLGWNVGAIAVTSLLALCLVAVVWIRFRDWRANNSFVRGPGLSSAQPGSPVPAGSNVLGTSSPSPSIVFATNSPTSASAESAGPTATILPTITSTASTPPTRTPYETPTPPVVYRLQRGEYPYCIARRFNVDPYELLALNGLLGQQVFYSGTTLQLPPAGYPFPGDRMLRVHPALYRVSGSGETIYTLACAFGDADPLLIAQANNLLPDSALLTGQELQIP